MPIYDYSCPACGTKENVWAKMGEQELPCATCGLIMRRLISASSIRCDLEPYLDVHLGHDPVWVQSRQHKRSELKKRGLVEIG